MWKDASSSFKDVCSVQQRFEKEEESDRHLGLAFL